MKNIRDILIALAALACFALSTPAQAAHRGNYATLGFTGCNPAYTDGGCSGAQANSNFYNPSLFSTAQQDGTYTLLPTHPMGYNVPGQDYPIGYDKTLVLKDPQGNPPAGCTFNNALRPGNIVLCNSANPDVEGYDFTGAISAVGVPITLDYGPNTSGVCTVKNNKFLVDSTNSNSAMHFENGTCSRVYKYNECKGSGSSGIATCIQDDSRTSSNSAVYQYSDFPNQSLARVISSVGSGGWGLTWLFQYNFVEGLNPVGAGGQHGEVDIYGGQCNTSCPITITSKEWSNNFIIWDSVPTQIDNTASFYTSAGDTYGYFVGATTMNSNVIVTNINGVGGPSVSAALTRGGWSSLGNFTANNNYINPRGAYYCALNGAANNWAITAFNASQVGNILTISSFPSSGWTGSDIQAGYNVNNGAGGYTQSTIQAFGTNGTTGTGGTGTYAVSGPAQTLSNTQFILTPGLLSVTSSGNKNLTDNSAMDFTAPYLFPAACNNAA